MNRTENQEQSRAKKRGRGKRGNEIVAREKEQEMAERREERRRSEREEKTIQEEKKAEKSRRAQRPAFKMRFLNDVLKQVCLYKFPITLTSPWKLLSKGATCFRKS